MRALIVAVLIALAGTASAGPSAADAHAKRGKQLYDQKRYQESIAEYRAAYQLDRKPTRLFNIAQAHRLNGDAEEALEHYRKYVELDPGGRGVPDAKTHIASLEKMLSRMATKTTPPVPEPVPEPAPDPDPSPSTRPHPPEPVPAAGPVDMNPGKGMRTWGMVLAISGLTVFLLGANYAAELSAKEEEIARLQPGSSVWDPGLDSDAEAASFKAVLCYSLGSAAMLGGAVVYYVGVYKDIRARTRVHATPVAGPGYGGVAIRGRF